MAKGAYIGINSQAAKIKKIYIGINGIAQEVKRAYVGINGVAQLWWTGEELKYAGAATPLSVARYSLAATHVGNYALFGGGYGNGICSVVDTYNKSLTRTTATSLSVARHSIATTHVGNYALFGGGNPIIGTGGGGINPGTIKVDAYNTSLTHTTTSLGISRYDLAATHVGNYALFGGGVSYDANSIPTYWHYSTLDAYDIALTRTAPTELSSAGRSIAATNVGNYALFAGGYNNSYNVDAPYISNVDVYDTSLTRTTTLSLSTARIVNAATHVGNYALFSGGNNGYIDVYDTSLTHTTPISLSVARRSIAATHFGNYALFGGGYNSSFSKIVDVYDESLTKTITTELSVGRQRLAATHIGNYALFGGGDNDGGCSATVDVYTID